MDMGRHHVSKHILKRDSSIFVAGHRGMVGSSIIRALKKSGYNNLILRSRNELDLSSREAVRDFFSRFPPDLVILCAARVGGIIANSNFPADFIEQNLNIEVNIISEAQRAGVTRLLFFGSSCVYPRCCPQPIREDYLLSGPLEPTNRPYAIAKIAGIELCWAFNRQHGTGYFSIMPPNLYGLGDNYDPYNSHVIPGLIQKMHAAKTNGNLSMTAWGSGQAKREFLLVDDLAEACLFLLSCPDNCLEQLVNDESPPIINVGYGEEITIKKLSEIVQEVTGFKGQVDWDMSKPDGTPRKILSTTKMDNLGWKANTDLRTGIKIAYKDYLSHITKISPNLAEH